MSRTIGSNGSKTMEAINQAGLALIYERGFEGMSLRQLADRVGIQPGSLYNHINTKQDLLLQLLRTHMESLLIRLDEALAGAAGPAAQLRAFVAFHVNYHIARKAEVFICYSELRSLEAGNYEAITALRGAYEQRLMDILDRGAAARVFAVEDVPVAAYGILAMLTGVCTWFQPDGRLSADEVAGVYTGMVMKAVEHR